MSVTVTYLAKVTAVETLETNVPAAAAANRKVTHSLFDTSKTLDGSSTPPATLVAAFEKALAAGVATIDLRALVGTNNVPVDGNGLRVQVLRIRAKSTNANPITIAKGASNGYDGFGAGFSLTLAPGAEQQLFTNDGGGDISGTNKTLDLTGTLTQALEVEIILG